jgi:hypothetical protein
MGSRRAAERLFAALVGSGPRAIYGSGRLVGVPTVASTSGDLPDDDSGIVLHYQCAAACCHCFMPTSRVGRLS